MTRNFAITARLVFAALAFPIQTKLREDISMKQLFNRKILLVLSAVTLLFALNSTAFAQEITGSISGVVTDSAGAAVKGASVTITDTEKNAVARTVTTNDDGEYSAPLLPVGLYDITVEAPSFKKHVDSQVKLNVNERRRVDVTLEAGNIAEVVTVTSDLLQVNTQSAAASNVN